ncbi:MAG: hypothetical protein ABI723_10305 [Bacteroidia bacterium]
MFGSVALDVTIGLVFVFLLYSLMATIINEIIATFIGMRARFLRKGIERMLNDEYIEKFERGFGLWLNFKILLKKIWLRFSAILLIENYRFKNTLAHAFYSHPYMFYMGENKFHSKPGYLKNENFSRVLIAVLNGEGKNNPENILAAIKKGEVTIRDVIKKEDIIYKIDEATKSELKDRLVEVDMDIKKFKASLESWFDDTMDRASGWYKRKVQLLLFVIGLIIAVIFNVNTFKIVGVLSKDKDARNQLVTLASNVSKQQDFENKITLAKDTTAKAADAPDSLLVQRLQLLKKAYNDLNKDSKDATQILAMGWGFDTVPVYALATDASWKKASKNFYFKAMYVLANTFHPLSNLFGFIVTALALSLGAAFWFDLLKKLVEIRGSGKVPDEDNTKKVDMKLTKGEDEGTTELKGEVTK